MNESPRWLGFAAAAVVVVLVALSWWSERPPSPRPATAPADQFSAERALEHLEVIAVRPHMTGSADHVRVRDYLVDELDALGFEVEVQRATVAQPRGRVTRSATVRNIVARKRGTDSTGGIAVTSHYDSQQLTPGAGDDGSGVSATLEALRAIGESEPLRNDLYVFITDAEELGLLGAGALVNQHEWWENVDVLLNFEARGSSGQSVMFETNDGNGWVVGEFARADAYPTGSSLYYEIYRRLPNDTDFSVYKRAGVTGLNFALAESADVYHRPTDNIQNLSMASLQHHGEHALSMTRHFGSIDLSAPRDSGNRVFFRFPGLGLVSYPFFWVGPLTILALLFAAFVVDRGFRAGSVSPVGALVGLLLAVAAIVVSAGAGWLLWELVRGMHHELGSLQGRSLYNEHWYALAIGALAVASVSAWLAAARSMFNMASLMAGVLLLPLSLALLTWWYAPGVSMLFLWPGVMGVGAIRLLVARRTDDEYRVIDLAALALLALPVVLILFPLVWTLYQGLNIEVAPLIGGVAALLLLLILPLLDVAGQAGRSWLPATALGLAVAFTVVGVVDARPGPSRPVPADLIYAHDRELGTSVWATMQEGPDGWIENFVGDDAELLDLAPFLAGNPRPYRRSPAPLIDAPRALVRVVDESFESGTRRVRLEIASAVGPELLNVSPAPGSTATLIAVNEAAVPPRIDGGSQPWLLQHFGQPPEGILTLDVRGSADAPLDLVLVEYTMRLPPVPGYDMERPPGFTPYAMRLTDVAMFRQLIRVPADR